MYKIFLILLLASCTTTKYIDREKVVVDSSVVEQNEALQRTLHETIERHEKEKEQWENTGILFESKSYLDSVKWSNSIPAKIVFENGKLKSIEGNVRSLNQNLYAKSSELSEARETIDSMKAALAKKETNLERTTVTVTKKIKTRFFPWWLLILIPVILLIGSFAENRFKYIRHFQRIFSLLKI